MMFNQSSCLLSVSPGRRDHQNRSNGRNTVAETAPFPIACTGGLPLATAAARLCAAALLPAATPEVELVGGRAAASTTAL